MILTQAIATIFIILSGLTVFGVFVVLPFYIGFDIARGRRD